jgi:hypothetical protein
MGVSVGYCNLVRLAIGAPVTAYLKPHVHRVIRGTRATHICGKTNRGLAATKQANSPQHHQGSVLASQLERTTQAREMQTVRTSGSLASPVVA